MVPVRVVYLHYKLVEQKRVKRKNAPRTRDADASRVSPFRTCIPAAPLRVGAKLGSDVAIDVLSVVVIAVVIACLACTSRRCSLIK